MWSDNVLKRLADSRWTSFKVDEVTNFGALRNNSDEIWEITSASPDFPRSFLRCAR